MSRPAKVSVNLVADYFDRGGWGRHARSFGAALARHARVALCNSNPHLRPDHQPDDDGALSFDLEPDPEAATVALGPCDWLARAPGTRQICYVPWETSKVPAPHLETLRRAEQVWVPTEWGRRLFERAGLEPERLRVVPEGVDAELFRPAPEPRDRNRSVFRFLCVGKWETRKGTRELVRAFREEFRESEPVELVMQCHNPYLPGFDLDRAIREACPENGGGPAIVAAPQRSLPGLVRTMQGSDAFVLPTRAEGWGLPILEAMACGLPCIVTDYGAHRAFADDTNSYLIEVAGMCAVEDPLFFDPVHDWGEWADPDVADLRRLLRHVYENPEEAAETGRRARLDAERRWSWDRAARIALASLPAEAG